MTEKHGVDLDGPTCEAGWAGLRERGTHDVLNEAWLDGDLEEFDAALSAYLRASACSFRRALARAAWRERGRSITEQFGIQFTIYI